MQRTSACDDLRSWSQFIAFDIGIFVAVVMSDDDVPMCGPASGCGKATTTRSKQGRNRKHKKDRRSPLKPKQDRFSKMLDMHAKEGREGETASEGDISEDDRDASDLSYVTDGSAEPPSPGMRGLYLQSLSSQAEMLGFGTPMHKKRHKERGEGMGSIVASIVEKNDRKNIRKNPDRIGIASHINAVSANITDAVIPVGESLSGELMASAPSHVARLTDVDGAADMAGKAVADAIGVSVTGSCSPHDHAATDVDMPSAATRVEGAELTTVDYTSRCAESGRISVASDAGCVGITDAIDDIRHRTSRMKLKPKTNSTLRPVVQTVVAVAVPQASKVTQEQEEQVYVRRGTICVDTPPPRSSTNKSGRKCKAKQGASSRLAVQALFEEEAAPAAGVKPTDEISVGCGAADGAVDTSAFVANGSAAVDVAIGICGCNSYRARIGICEAEIRVKDAIIDRLHAELSIHKAVSLVLACVEREKEELSKLRGEIAQFFE